MYELIEWLSVNHAMPVLLALGVLLVSIDYFFRTDVPAHFGYLSFAMASFFAIRAPILQSIFFAMSVLVVLEALHWFVFCRFLHNAPGKERVPKEKTSKA